MIIKFSRYTGKNVYNRHHSQGGMVLVFSTYNANGCRGDVKYSMREQKDVS